MEWEDTKLQKKELSEVQVPQIHAEVQYLHLHVVSH